MPPPTNFLGASTFRLQHVPSVVWPARQGDTWVKINSDDIFKNRTVAVFSLPGAFTPTCSSTHLPRYNELGMYTPVELTVRFWCPYSLTLLFILDVLAHMNV